MEGLKTYIKEHKLMTIGGLWACGIGASMALQWRGASSTSVKVIHSRLYAQAMTLSALVASAGVEFYDRTYFPKPAEEVDVYSYDYQQKLKMMNKTST
eukprot:5243628-Pyramimonas_sp.AAC.1